MAALGHQRTSASPTAASAVTQLEFHQAMSDFKTMFPSMDEDVIECVLRSNNGAVDSTIDQLLAMASDLEKQLSTIQSTGNGVSKPVNPQNQLISLEDEETVSSSHLMSQTPPPSYSQAVPDSGSVRIKNCNLNQQPQFTSDFSATGTSSAGASSSSSLMEQKVSNNSLRHKFKWNPPLLGVLPDNFLRFTDAPASRFHQQREASAQYDRQRSQSDRSANRRSEVLSTSLLQQKMQENTLKRQQTRSDDTEATQFLEDEKIAILLQNEEFVRELRHNKDFMSQLQIDAARGSPAAAAGSVSDAAFKEMLKNMSKVSRKKFAQVAGMFTRRKRKDGTSVSLSSPVRHQSKDFLLGKDDEYHELENDSSDSEDRHSPYWERPAGRRSDPPDPHFSGPDHRSPDRDRNSGFRL